MAKKKRARSGRSTGKRVKTGASDQLRDLKEKLAATKQALLFAEHALRCAPSERQQDKDRVRATGLAIRKASELQLSRPPGLDTGSVNPRRLPCDLRALVFGWGRGSASATDQNAERTAMNEAISEAQNRARTKVQSAIDAVRCPDNCPKRLAIAIRLEIVDRDSTFDGSKASATALCFSWAVVVCSSRG